MVTVLWSPFSSFRYIRFTLSLHIHRASQTCFWNSRSVPNTTPLDAEWVCQTNSGAEEGSVCPAPLRRLAGSAGLLTGWAAVAARLRAPRLSPRRGPGVTLQSLTCRLKAGILLEAPWRCCTASGHLISFGDVSVTWAGFAEQLFLCAGRQLPPRALCEGRNARTATKITGGDQHLNKQWRLCPGLWNRIPWYSRVELKKS